jgi:hypothetical protein
MPSYDRELTKHHCEQVIMLRHNPIKIGKETFYKISNFKTHADAEKAAEIVREFGYNARVINDYGSAVAIKESNKKKGRK